MDERTALCEINAVSNEKKTAMDTVGQVELSSMTHSNDWRVSNEKTTPSPN